MTSTLIAYAAKKAKGKVVGIKLGEDKAGKIVVLELMDIAVVNRLTKTEYTKKYHELVKANAKEAVDDCEFKTPKSQEARTAMDLVINGASEDDVLSFINSEPEGEEVFIKNTRAAGGTDEEDVQPTKKRRNTVAKKTTKKAGKKKVAKKVAKKTASKKAASKKTAKKTAAKKIGRPSTSDEILGKKVKVISKTNRKRGTAAERFALYKDGMTVQAYVKAGGTVRDVKWDVKQGFIKLTG